MPRIDLEVTEAQHAELVRKADGSVANYIRKQLGFDERRPGRPRKGSAAEAVERLGEAVSEYRGQVQLAKRFFCPVRDCGFASTSQAARCPSHGRKVV